MANGAAPGQIAATDSGAGLFANTAAQPVSLVQPMTAAQVKGEASVLKAQGTARNAGAEPGAMIPTADKTSSNATRTVAGLSAAMLLVLGLASGAFWKLRR